MGGRSSGYTGARQRGHSGSDSPRHHQFRNLDFIIQVVEIAGGELVPFEVELHTTERHVNVTFGRSRWTPDGSAIVFVGQDENGREGIFAQDFLPGRNTLDTRRRVIGFSRDYTTESLGVSTDGDSIVISAMYDRRSLMLADHISLRHWK